MCVLLLAGARCLHPTSALRAPARQVRERAREKSERERERARARERARVRARESILRAPAWQVRERVRARERARAHESVRACQGHPLGRREVSMEKSGDTQYGE